MTANAVRPEVCPDDNTMLSGRRITVDGQLQWTSWCWRCRRAWLDDGRSGHIHDPAGIWQLDRERLGEPGPRT